MCPGILQLSGVTASRDVVLRSDWSNAPIWVISASQKHASGWKGTPLMLSRRSSAHGDGLWTLNRGVSGVDEVMCRSRLT